MKIGIFGTGVVGTTIGSGLTALGHEVMLGSRTHDNEKGAAWAANAGPGAAHDTYEETAKFGEILFNCTSGAGSLDAIAMAGDANTAGKVLLDVANPLDFSQGFPPSLTVCNTDSLAEQIQRAHPNIRVVKTLNTMTASVMVNPSLVPGEHNVFLSGNDADAKATASEVLGWFGWKSANIIDVGDITTARGTEMLLPIWVRLYGALGNPNFNFHIAR
jgi:predicted dinucleotide-binding enzyme